MQTIDKTRRERLEELIATYGSIAALNASMGMDRTDATFSQIRNQALHSKTGKPRVMGDDLARKIEDRLKKPEGWMDTPPGYADLTDSRIQHVMKMMEAMPEWQRDQAMKILIRLLNQRRPRQLATVPKATMAPRASNDSAYADLY